jgi:2,4-dienoyl-CoA reductase-like NADH-dependent reductase (Old Yellow Enzyme family)
MTTNNLIMEEIKMNNLTLKNRIVFPPMSKISAEKTGEATEKMKEYYEEFAKNGFGLIITEGAYVDEKKSRALEHQVGMANEAQEKAWMPITEAAHSYVSRIIAQIAHSGLITDITTIEEIQEDVKAFGIAAARAERAGFDGVEIHAALGLPNQFLSKKQNTREDTYGVDVAGRMRFLLEAIAEVKAQTSTDFIIGVRVRPGEDENEADMEQFFTTLGKAGVTYLHTSEMDALKPVFEGSGETYSAIAKKYSKVIVIAAGGLG